MRVCVAELPRAGKAQQVLSQDGLTPLAAPGAGGVSGNLNRNKPLALSCSKAGLSHLPISNSTEWNVWGCVPTHPAESPWHISASLGALCVSDSAWQDVFYTPRLVQVPRLEFPSAACVPLPSAGEWAVCSQGRCCWTREGP